MTREEEEQYAAAWAVIAEAVAEACDMLPATHEKRPLMLEMRLDARSAAGLPLVASPVAPPAVEESTAGLVWLEQTPPQREAAIFDVLAGDAMTISEITDALRDRGYRVVPQNVRDFIATKMLSAGLVDRDAEKWRGKLRYRYFVRRDLDGPIADLDRAFHHDEDETE